MSPVAAPRGGTRVITEARALAPVIDDWRRLAHEAGLPFASPSWCLAFWRTMHEPEGNELRVVVVHEGGRVVGIGPFYRSAPTALLGDSTWWTLGSGIAQRTGPLAARGHHDRVAAGIAEAMIGDQPPPSLLRLPAGDAAAGWGRRIEERWPVGRRPRVRQHGEPGLAVQIPAGGSYATWLGNQSKNFRSEIGRRGRNFGRDGGSVRLVVDPQELGPAITTLFELHLARFAELRKPSGLNERTRRATLAASFALATDEPGALRVWTAEAEGRVLGALMFAVAGLRMCFYNGGIDPEAARASLGTVLLARAVEDAHDLGLEILDLGAGDQHYKQRFAGADDPLIWSTVVPRGVRYPLTRARMLPEEGQRALRARLARLPEDQLARVKSLTRRG